MSIENREPGKNSEETEEPVETNSQVWERRLNEAKEYSTEKQNEVAEIHEAKLGVTLRRLMEGSGDNPEIVNNLEEFLDGMALVF